MCVCECMFMCMQVHIFVICICMLVCLHVAVKGQYYMLFLKHLVPHEMWSLRNCGPV